MPDGLMSGISHVLIVDQRTAKYIHRTGRIPARCDIIRMLGGSDG